MKKNRLVFLVMSVGLIAACSTPPRSPAPVVDRTPGPANKPVEIAVSKPAPAVPKPAPIKADGHGYYTVKRGDTLYRIALDIGQNYRDIIAWNNLSDPNDIKVDQVLRVLPPEPTNVTSGVQTASVVSAPTVEVKPLSAPAPVPAPSVSPATAGSSVPNKAGPRGDKRAYSDAALAELQKAETIAAPIALAAPTPGSGPKAEAPKSSEKQVEAPAASISEEETVSWMWPAEGKIVANFDDGKKGIDIAGKNGQQVVAAGSGKVMYAGSGIRGYGNLVIVKHTSNLLSAYAHNKTILVKEGQIVNKGQKIAEMGSSDADAVKLHFEIRQQGKPVDPSKFLPNR